MSKELEAIIIVAVLLFFAVGFIYPIIKGIMRK